MVGEVHKAESSGPAPLVLHHSHAERPPWQCEDNQSVKRTRDIVNDAARLQNRLTKGWEDLLEFLIGVVFTKVFDVDIGELQSFAAQLLLSLFTGFKVSDKTAKKKKAKTVMQMK